MRLRRSFPAVAAAVAAALVVAAVPAAARAQSSSDHAFSVGVLAGGTLPGGGISNDMYDPGYHVGGLAQYQTPVRWLAVRVDGTYGRLGNGTQDFVDERGVVAGRLTVVTNVVTAAASVVARVGESVRLVPLSLGVRLR